jgi:hypothetical protein
VLVDFHGHLLQLRGDAAVRFGEVAADKDGYWGRPLAGELVREDLGEDADPDVAFLDH